MYVQALITVSLVNCCFLVYASQDFPCAEWKPVFLSGQAGLSGGFQMRAGPSLAAFLGGLSLNRIFCSKDSLLPLLRKSPKYET